jgi:hypothetical protein
MVSPADTMNRYDENWSPSRRIVRAASTADPPQ